MIKHNKNLKEKKSSFLFSRILIPFILLIFFSSVTNSYVHGSPRSPSGKGDIYSTYDSTSGFYQIYSRTFPRKINQLTDSLFDKDNPVWGTRTTGLNFNESETSTSETCVGTLFYYLGDAGGMTDIYLACLGSDGQVINDYPLTGYDESSTFDIAEIFHTEGENVTYTQDDLEHDAEPLVFVTSSNETYVLLHDSQEIYDDGTNLDLGNVKYYPVNDNGNGFTWSGVIIYENSDDDVTVTLDSSQNSENSNNNENNNSSESNSEANSQNTQTTNIDVNVEIYLDPSNETSESGQSTEDDTNSENTETLGSTADVSQDESIAEVVDNYIASGGARCSISFAAKPSNINILFLPLLVILLMLRFKLGKL